MLSLSEKFSSANAKFGGWKAEIPDFGKI